jgi:hypothetical protein
MQPNALLIRQNFIVVKAGVTPSNNSLLYPMGITFLNWRNACEYPKNKFPWKSWLQAKSDEILYSYSPSLTCGTEPTHQWWLHGAVDYRGSIPNEVLSYKEYPVKIL